MGAIVEVYASVYGPDSIRYRAERGLLDFHEEMEIMIQQVVGKEVGPYFMPLYSGVAVNNNRISLVAAPKKGKRFDSVW